MGDRMRYMVFMEGQAPIELWATERHLTPDLDLSLEDGGRPIGWFDHRWLQGWIAEKAAGAAQSDSALLTACRAVQSAWPEVASMLAGAGWAFEGELMHAALVCVDAAVAEADADPPGAECAGQRHD